MSDFPRLLVATEFPPNASGGGPSVVRQMLKGWPAEKLFWWSCFPEQDARFGQNVAGHEVANPPGRLYPNQRWLALKSWFMENWWAPGAARNLRGTLEAIKPDVVWVIPHAWAVPPVARGLESSPVAYHTTVQDYVDAQNGIKRLGESRARRFAGLAERLYKEAATRDATSHPMIADLRSRTGSMAAQMLHAGLEQDDFDWLEREPAIRGRPVRIAYAGTIVVEKEFELFVRAVAAIRNRLPDPVTLEFFASHEYRQRGWFDHSWMREHGNLAEPALTAALRECTWGFAPMALNDGDPRYNHFSFPTKFISYLAAGLPVITLGHAESSVVRMAAEYDVGMRWTTPVKTEFSQALLGALALPLPAQKFRAEIRRCAKTEFDADRMRRILHACFQTCAFETAKRGGRS